MSDHSDTHTELSFKWHCIFTLCVDWAWVSRDSIVIVHCITVTQLHCHWSMTSLRHCTLSPVVADTLLSARCPGGPSAVSATLRLPGASPYTPHPTVPLTKCKFLSSYILTDNGFSFLIKIGILFWLVLRNMGFL